MKVMRNRLVRGGMLAAVLAAAGALSVIGIWNESAGANPYYAAAVRSMMESFHNFFYVSFDPGGFISVDKPPLALWLQTGSAFLFGFHAWSLILPESLAAVAAVYILYRTAARVFGFAAGILSAAALAVTPIFIAIARSNNVDAILILLTVLASDLLLRAAETGRMRFLLLAMVTAGLGYNTKMLAAFMVLPAFAAAWLCTGGPRFSGRVGRLAVGGALLLAVSFSWSAAVDLTPAADRPYVGSSSTNSEINLAFGYNGILRVIPGLYRGTETSAASSALKTAGASLSAGPKTASRDLDEVGRPGPLRLINQQLGSQVSWFLPLALIGGLAAAADAFRRRRADRRPFIHLVFWLAWLIPMDIYYSFSAGYIHRYYLGMLTPCLAALAGIGAVSLWKRYRRGGKSSLLLPAAIFLTAALQIGLMFPFRHWSRYLIEIVMMAGAAAAAALTALRGAHSRTPARIALAVGLVGLFISPAAWSASAILYNQGGGNPYAGPLTAAASRPIRLGSTVNTVFSFRGESRYESAERHNQLSDFLLRNRNHAKYLMAAYNAAGTESVIIDTGKPVMAVGGFSGNDHPLTPQQFEQMVQRRQIRYFLVTGIRPGVQSAILQWVAAHGSPVPTREYASSSSTGSQTVLYDLSRA